MANRYEHPDGKPLKDRVFSEEEVKERAWFLDFLRNLKESVEKGELVPSADWDTVWVISGPEVSLDIEPEEGEVNQTKERLEAGFKLLKEVTALRVQKEISDVTVDDIQEFGPTLYFNGFQEQNEIFKELVVRGDIQQRYGVPQDHILITDTSTITHTGHQFEELPDELINQARKIAVVSSWYHCPRIQKYIEQKASALGSEDLLTQMVVYPADIELLRLGRAVGEAKKVWDYFEHHKGE